eukprot:2728018-Rhodomonas_salina.2
MYVKAVSVPDIAQRTRSSTATSVLSPSASQYQYRASPHKRVGLIGGSYLARSRTNSSGQGPAVPPYASSVPHTA